MFRSVHGQEIGTSLIRCRAKSVTMHSRVLSDRTISASESKQRVADEYGLAVLVIVNLAWATEPDALDIHGTIARCCPLITGHNLHLVGPAQEETKSPLLFSRLDCAKLR